MNVREYFEPEEEGIRSNPQRSVGMTFSFSIKSREVGAFSRCCRHCMHVGHTFESSGSGGTPTALPIVDIL